ncbi:radical SAM protein [Myxococcota bacterium]|nr:radical SAM protein [Myxococcota bacterium]MBU1380558.1 radical SAM protein [Myxococcota bacterium]MBU1497892.1 radical SAM protein [Myxococcota bacterium]
MSTQRLRFAIILLTRKCLFQCAHCDVFSSPRSSDTFTPIQIRKLLQRLRNTGITDIIISGGEPFLYFPLLRYALNECRNNGFRTTVWTSGYWLSSRENLEINLKILAESGLNQLLISSDQLHLNEKILSSSDWLKSECAGFNISLGFSSHSWPETGVKYTLKNGALPIGGVAFIRGRGAQTTEAEGNIGILKYSINDLAQCPHQNLLEPEYLYFDFQGNIMPCPGISYGNIFKGNLQKTLSNEKLKENPFIRHILTKGFIIDDNNSTLEKYADHCHACFKLRTHLRKAFPAIFPEYYYKD